MDRQIRQLLCVLSPLCFILLCTALITDLVLCEELTIQTQAVISDGEEVDAVESITSRSVSHEQVADAQTHALIWDEPYHTGIPERSNWTAYLTLLSFPVTRPPPV